MRVLLLTPPYYVPLKTFAISVGQPLGIAYVGAALRQAGHEVRLLDGLMSGRIRSLTPADLTGSEHDRLRISRGVFARHALGEGFPDGATSVGASFEQIEAEIRRYRPQIVGISVIFSSIFRTAAALAERIKRIDPNIVLVMGGTHVTVSPDSVLANPAVDYIVTGEGEHAVVQLLAALEAEQAVDDIPGVGCRKSDGSMHLTPSKLIDDLDVLPMPALDLLNMDDYFETMAEGRAGKLYTTRGCPFNCSFCSVPLTSNRRFRVHSIERVNREIDWWMDTHGVETLIFEDDNINTAPKRFKNLLRALNERPRRCRIDARNLRADLLDDETLALMRAVGYDIVWITPESGNQRVLDEVINKRMRVRESREAARRILDHGLQVGAAFVIGFPGESRQELQDTIDYAYELKAMGVRSFWVSIATPIEGTALYRSAMESGLISGIDLNRFTYNMATFDTDAFRREELETWRARMMDDLNRVDSAQGRPADLDILASHAENQAIGSRI